MCAPFVRFKQSLLGGPNGPTFRRWSPTRMTLTSHFPPGFMAAPSRVERDRGIAQTMFICTNGRKMGAHANFLKRAAYVR